MRVLSCRLAEIAKALNRPVVCVSGLQSRFELPVLEGASYNRGVSNLSPDLGASANPGNRRGPARELWNNETKLLHLLHAVTTGSQTWFLDSCGVSTNQKQRLLLTNHDVGVVVHGIGLILA